MNNLWTLVTLGRFKYENNQNFPWFLQSIEDQKLENAMNSKKTKRFILDLSINLLNRKQNINWKKLSGIVEFLNSRSTVNTGCESDRIWIYYFIENILIEAKTNYWIFSWYIYQQHMSDLIRRRHKIPWKFHWWRHLFYASAGELWSDVNSCLNFQIKFNL